MLKTRAPRQAIRRHRMEQKATAAGGRGTYIATVLGAALGMAVGFAAIFISTNGVFIPAVLRDFHWGRAQAAQSYAASMLGLALVSPLVGILMDRFGVRRVVLISAIVFASALACMGLQDGHQGWWIALSLVIGMSGAATSVLGYLAILPQWFDRRLGLAIGLAMVGLGVGTIVLPALSQHLIAGFGWRGAYQILAGISLVGAVIAYTLLRERRGHAKASPMRGSGEFATDASISGRLKLFRIVVIFLAAFLASSAALSLGPHLPALLIDRGISAHDAARSASLVGLDSLTELIL
ncbi:MFS transporter [Caballeronia arationis]|nr:MFS transporter [Caballeronia arationis]